MNFLKHNTAPHIMFWIPLVGHIELIVLAVVFLAFIGLVLAKKAKPPLILFGVFDAAGAIWTLLTLT